MNYVFPDNTIEGTIERRYRSLIGSQDEADFRRLVDEIKDISIPPPNYGDILIESAGHDTEVRDQIARLRKHGVRDEDIRWWYNKHPLEQKCIASLQDMQQLGMWIAQTSEGISAGEASIDMYKKFPRIGNPDDPNWGGDVRAMLTEADRPLPCELLGAIAEFLASRSRNASFLSRLSGSSSLNALVRATIESGEFYQDFVEPRLSDAEAFFVSKICDGLSRTSCSLTPEEKHLLLTPMQNVAELPNFSSIKYRNLESRCVKAITDEYARDAVSGGLDSAFNWRKHIDSLYNHSKLIVSDIMQTWYLSVGRDQESKARKTTNKQSTGCLSAIVLVVVGLIFSVAGSAALAAGWYR